MDRPKLLLQEPTPVLMPLTAAAFAALMKPFAFDHKPLAIAVSGGLDSMALAWCVKRWAQASGNTVLAFIVDHQLRPESSEESEQTKQNLASMDIEAKILRWEHPPVSTGLHIAARQARYALLIKACHDYAIQNLLLAHHRDDQAETILMRLAKGSGIDGLAGMTAMHRQNGVNLVRPLLGIAKETLKATCLAENIPFVTDPSNHSPKYARGRLRRVMPLLADEGLTVDTLCDLGERAGEAKDALTHYTNALLRVAMKMDAAGTVQFNLEQLRSAPRAISLRALAICLQTMQPDDYAPERDSLCALLDALCIDTPMPPRTLHGCLISKKHDSFTIIREYNAIRDVQSIQAGETILWDNRWRVTLSPHAPHGDYTIRALGIQPHNILDAKAPLLRQKIPQGRVRAALPSLWEGNKLVAGNLVFDRDNAVAWAAGLHGARRWYGGEIVLAIFR